MDQLKLVKEKGLSHDNLAFVITVEFAGLKRLCVLQSVLIDVVTRLILVHCSKVVLNTVRCLIPNVGKCIIYLRKEHTPLGLRRMEWAVFVYGSYRS